MPLVQTVTCNNLWCQAAAVVSMGLPVASKSSVTLASDVAEGAWVVPAEVLHGVINVCLKLNSSFKSKV